jgi:L-threonylcarbamoyladenylate synthase
MKGGIAGEADIERAVRTLREGGLVAFPTETVYGLGADAANPEAVERIFAAKGRPADHPLIVHIPDAGHMDEWAREVPEEAKKLASLYWPGPLTIVLPRREHAPDIVTGGLDTIALRVPGHPLALALLGSFGAGLAAPSANRHGRVSPTTASHVREELGDAVEMILDGGACGVGLESTIVDLASATPRVLRPGAVTTEMLERVLGAPVPVAEEADVRAPGQMPSHYAPRARVEVAASGSEALRAAERGRAEGLRVGLLGSERPEALPDGVVALELDGDLDEQARQLYERLRQADHLGLDLLVVIAPEGEGIAEAMRDRLRRAAGPRGG